MGLAISHMDGETPLDEDEKEGLLNTTIATRGELNEFEQRNIEQAVLWSLNRSFKPEIIFSEAFIKELHIRMYGDVWSWAGKFRKTNKNIGVDKWQIQADLKTLLDDVAYWYAKNVYTPDEMTIRFKHRVVQIHCFANGNGRHSRLLADIVISKLFKLPVYSWGAANFVDNISTRSEYLAAIKAADNGFIRPLVDFARS